MNNKQQRQGQGLPINYVVMAALALIALIIIVMLMTGKIRFFNKNVEDCETKGGECVAQGSCSGFGQVDLTCPKDRVCCTITCKALRGTCQSSCDPKTETEVPFVDCDEKKVCCTKRETG
ncbi:hypothetical protein HYW21_03370 [Candidatus Woesearchaeota archaeon]|nr:hypothetical protein [Candidatus Woesearchaeota archaeon]